MGHKTIISLSSDNLSSCRDLKVCFPGPWCTVSSFWVFISVVREYLPVSQKLGLLVGSVENNVRLWPGRDVTPAQTQISYKQIILGTFLYIICRGKRFWGTKRFVGKILRTTDGSECSKGKELHLKLKKAHEIIFFLQFYAGKWTRIKFVLSFLIWSWSCSGLPIQLRRF